MPNSTNWHTRVKQIFMSLSEVLKTTIRDSGKNLNQIAKESGIARPMLHRFMSVGDDRRDIRLETADKLADYFGLKLVPDKTKKAPKK